MSSCKSVQRSSLYKLLEDVRKLPVDGLPIIAGSQAIHAVTDQIPEIVRRSIECDLLYAGGKAEVRALINRELGVLTDYQHRTGIYADAVGLATVILPGGWEERLVPLVDNTGETVARCVEIHDVAASKLIAGRAKDFDFIIALLTSGVIEVEPFLERIDLIESKVENAVIPDRLKKLENKLRDGETGEELLKRLRHRSHR
jgi:hypothetical protein